MSTSSSSLASSTNATSNRPSDSIGPDGEPSYRSSLATTAPLLGDTPSAQTATSPANTDNLTTLEKLRRTGYRPSDEDWKKAHKLASASCPFAMSDDRVCIAMFRLSDTKPESGLRTSLSKKASQFKDALFGKDPTQASLWITEQSRGELSSGSSNGGMISLDIRNGRWTVTPRWGAEGGKSGDIWDFKLNDKSRTRRGEADLKDPSTWNKFTMEFHGCKKDEEHKPGGLETDFVSIPHIG